MKYQQTKHLRSHSQLSNQSIPNTPESDCLYYKYFKHTLNSLATYPNPLYISYDRFLTPYRTFKQAETDYATINKNADLIIKL